MIIGIIPKLIYTHKDQLELSIEEKLIKFLKIVFPKSDLKILHDLKHTKIDLLVISGGNDILKFSKKQNDFKRYKLTNFYFKKLLTKIPIIGICYGAQFIANKFNSRFVRSKIKNNNKHSVIFSNKKKFKVNSFHNYEIKTLSKKFEIDAKTEDGNIELFNSLKLKVIGVIWHPEREKKFSKNDIKIIKKFYANCNTGIWKRKKNKIKNTKKSNKIKK